MEKGYYELKSNQFWDRDDYSQECNAYMKTKLFMAKRIAEQQNEIEFLKDQLTSQTLKHAQLYDSIKNLNENLNLLMKEREDRLNFSGQLTSSLIVEEGETQILKIGNEEDNGCKKSKKEQKIEKEKIFSHIKNENLELRKELELIKDDNIKKSLNLNKIINDKFILFIELSELVMSLRRIDLNLLNNFYLNSIENYTQKIKMNNNLKHFGCPQNVISSLGIKYNILSAQSQMTLLSSADNKNSLENTEICEKFLKTEDKLRGFDESKEICLDRYYKLIKTYENELISLALEQKPTMPYTFQRSFTSTNTDFI
jgi:hypothetical protein